MIVRLRVYGVTSWADCKVACVWWSNLRGRRRRTAMQASHHRCTCAVPRHATVWGGSNHHACCVGGRSMLASQRAAPRRRAAAGRAFFLRTSPSRRAEAVRIVGRAFLQRPSAHALRNRLAKAQPTAQRRPRAPPQQIGWASFISGTARSATPQMQAEKPRRAQQCGKGANEQCYEVFRPGGSAIFAIDLTWYQKLDTRQTARGSP